MNNSTALPGKKSISSLTLFEVLFSVYGFLFYTDTWWALFGETIPPVYSAIRYSILGVPLILLLLRGKTLLRVFTKGSLLWIFISVCVFSLAWSINPDLTTKGILRITLQISVFALYFSSRFNPKDQLYIIGSALGITVMVNLFYILAMPSVGIHAGDKFDGAWKGFYESKNEFSGSMLWAAIVCYIINLKDSNPFAKRITRIGGFLCPALILLSTSKSALVIFLALYVAIALLNKYIWQGSKSILLIDLAILLSCLVVSGVISNWVAIVSSLGKDPTMSGRTVLWHSSIIEIQQRPWLGHGFAGFWTEDNPAAMGIGESLSPGFYAHSAHNGFLNIALDVGWVGLGLFLIGFLSTWILALKYAYGAKSPEAFWPFAVILLVTIYNLVESSLNSEDINWLLYVLTYFSLRIWPQRAKVPLPEPNLQLAPSATQSSGIADGLTPTAR